MAAPRSVSLSDLTPEAIAVDVCGHTFRRAVITRTRQRALREAEAQLDLLAEQEAALAAERAERADKTTTSADLDADAAADDAFVAACGQLLDVLLVATATNGDGEPVRPSALIVHEWETDGELVSRESLLRLLGEIAGARGEVDPTEVSPPTS